MICITVVRTRVAPNERWCSRPRLRPHRTASSINHPFQLPCPRLPGSTRPHHRQPHQSLSKLYPPGVSNSLTGSASAIALILARLWTSCESRPTLLGVWEQDMLQSGITRRPVERQFAKCGLPAPSAMLEQALKYAECIRPGEQAAQ